MVPLRTAQRSVPATLRCIVPLRTAQRSVPATLRCVVPLRTAQRSVPAMKDYVCQPLGNQHDRTPFDCGVPVLNDYLAKYAKQDVTRKASEVS